MICSGRGRAPAYRQAMHPLQVTTTTSSQADVSPAMSPCVTLKVYRFSKELRGVHVRSEHAGGERRAARELRVGQKLEIDWK